jgi:hypothetical protein
MQELSLSIKVGSTYTCILTEGRQRCDTQRRQGVGCQPRSAEPHGHEPRKSATGETGNDWEQILLCCRRRVPASGTLVSSQCHWFLAMASRTEKINFCVFRSFLFVLFLWCVVRQVLDQWSISQPLVCSNSLQQETDFLTPCPASPTVVICDYIFIQGTSLPPRP